MDNARGVLLLREGFQHHVVALGLLILHQVVRVALLALHHQRVGCLTDFALKCLPEVGREVG